MKKTAIIAGITSGVLLVLFIISVAVTGVNVNVNTNAPIVFFGGLPIAHYVSGRSYVSGETTTDVFDGEIREIYISTSVANTSVRVANTDRATVKYTAKTAGVSFGAVLENGALKVQETAFLFLNWGSEPSVLEIELPAKEYEKVSFETLSGSTDVKELLCENITVNTASGHGNYSVFANDITVDTASGSVSVANCTGNKARTLSLSSASGSTEVSGFAADNFKIDCASGSVKVNGVSGKGDIDAASGIICLSYAEWNGDLDIDAASGSIDVQLPSGSGVDIDLDTFAGSVSYDLDGDNGSISGNSAASVGGSNTHEVNVDIASGNVYLHN